MAAPQASPIFSEYRIGLVPAPNTANGNLLTDGGWSSALTINPTTGAVALTGVLNLPAYPGGGQIQITPVGAGAVRASAFQYYTDNNLYIDAPSTGTPTGGSTYLRTGASALTLTLASTGAVTIGAPASAVTALTVNAATNGTVGLQVNGASGANCITCAPTAGQLGIGVNNGGTANKPWLYLGTNYFSTGTATPTLSANKPGANSGVSGWMVVSLNGTQGYIPVWT